MNLHTLLSRFRRKPLTPESARDRLSDAMDAAVADGLTGFCITVVSRPDSSDAQAVMNMRGDFTEALSRALKILMTEPETKTKATAAVMSALEAIGARVVQLVPDEDCDCPLCTIRREAKPQEKTTRH